MSPRWNATVAAACLNIANTLNVCCAGSQCTTCGKRSDTQDEAVAELKRLNPMTTRTHLFHSKSGPVLQPSTHCITCNALNHCLYLSNFVSGVSYLQDTAFIVHHFFALTVCVSNRLPKRSILEHRMDIAPPFISAEMAHYRMRPRIKAEGFRTVEELFAKETCDLM